MKLLQSCVWAVFSKRINIELCGRGTHFTCSPGLDFPLSLCSRVSLFHFATNQLAQSVVISLFKSRFILGTKMVRSSGVHEIYVAAPQILMR